MISSDIRIVKTEKRILVISPLLEPLKFTRIDRNPINSRAMPITWKDNEIQIASGTIIHRKI